MEEWSEGGRKAGLGSDAAASGEGDVRKRLHRLLKQDLGAAVKKTKEGTWATTSSLPHEIRLHEQSGVQLVRVSAGAVVGAPSTKALLATINDFNIERAFSRRILVGGKVLVVAEMPVASLRRGDSEQLVSMVFCCARLDAPVLAAHGGYPVTKPPTDLAPDLARTLHSWSDVLRASGTATELELATLIDDLAGCDCWVDRDDTSVWVNDRVGIATQYPFTLQDLVQSAQDLSEYEEDD